MPATAPEPPAQPNAMAALLEARDRARANYRAKQQLAETAAAEASLALDAYQLTLIAISRARCLPEPRP